MNRNQVKLTLPNDVAYLPLAQSFVRETAVIFGFSGKELTEMEIALEETFVNVITHGQNFESNETVKITCERIPRGITVRVHETGIPFDPGQLTNYKPSDAVGKYVATGLGMHLIRQMMDEVEFENLGPKGKETRLTKYRVDPKDAEADMVDDLKSELEPTVIQEQIPYSVRGLDPPEAIEISRCAYKSHGYSFFDDHIYYPQRLVAMNDSGELVSAVAVTQDNTFMGHAALLFQYPEDYIAELTFVFVNVEYRGQGAFTRLIDHLFSCPKKRRLTGMYAYAVANHVFTQKAMVRYAINDCGLLLATSPNSWKFKGIAGDSTQRISVVLSFKFMEPPVSKNLYVPEHHREIVEKLYRNIGAKDHRYVAPEVAANQAEQASEIESSCNESESCAEIFIKKFGTDVAKKVRRILRGFCVKQIACINLFLKLEDPGTYAYAAELEKLGFFFAGILPCTRTGDAIILQYLNNVDMDYSKINLYTDMAKELCAYIQARDPNANIS
jgi:anti-sigma regulatory factor (Ser/Thr protein kinase)